MLLMLMSLLYAVGNIFSFILTSSKIERNRLKPLCFLPLVLFEQTNAVSRRTEFRGAPLIPCPKAAAFVKTEGRGRLLHRFR